MANLLATEPSAYLQSAARQPVHWHPWGGAAFDTARTLDKPILLDIGAVWCHWCHVMDGESYEDPDIAKLLNEEFVCIKVDRDERPDVDARYQRAVQALTGQGGWPLTAFLDPQGEVFFGGTYFPPEPNPFGRPGFASVLRQVARLYREQRDKVAQNAAAIRQHVTEALNEAKHGTLAPRLLEDAANHMARLFDIRYGGFGTAPKFPHPAACEFLLARWHDTREDWIRDVVEKTLTAMARGGIRDHVGGGFHRYAVDERWIVPHFEKMAYDNAELLHAYLSGYAALGTAPFKEGAQGRVDSVLAVRGDRGPGAPPRACGRHDRLRDLERAPRLRLPARGGRARPAGMQRPRPQGPGTDLERILGRDTRDGPRPGATGAARPARRQRARGRRAARCLRSHGRRRVAASWNGRHAPLRSRSLGRPSRWILRHRTGPRRAGLPRYAGQARAGLPDPVGERRRGARAGPAVGADRRCRMAPAARPPARILRRRGGRALSLRGHAVSRHRLGTQPRHARRGGGPARRGSGVLDAPRRPPGLPAARSRGAQDVRSAGRHRMCRDHLLAARRAS